MSRQRAGEEKYVLDVAPIHRPGALQSYRVELPHDLLDEEGHLLEWVIGYAFDTLDAQHLDLRIVAPQSASVMTR
ncbi:MAG TPA: hypothetical protein VFO07_08870 [Roseiflexaceae bacterium]|nr:hypothetical protein [Roseiflexaceae bacterium]